MKQLLRRAGRLYAYSLLAGFMGAFLYLSVGVVTHTVTVDTKTLSPGATLLMNLIALLLQGFMFVTIVYSEMNRQGDKDSNRRLFEGQPGNPHQGLLVGLLTSVPAFITYLLMIADKLFAFWPACTTLYRVGQLALYPLLVWSMGPLWNTTTAQISWGGMLGAGISLLVLPAVSWVAYYWGYKQIFVSKKLMYKEKK